MENTNTAILSSHWTNGGDEVLILKCVGKDGSSYGGSFQWPLQVGTTVEALDWQPSQECGHGLHGWPWGLSIGDGMEPDWAGLWLVFGALPNEVIDLGGKCKAKRGTIRFVGDWHSALMFVLDGQMAFVNAKADKGAATSGDRSSAATSGYGSSAATSGYGSSAATSGDRSSAATSGYGSSAATSGYGSSAATSGYGSSAATSGDRSSAATSGDSSSAATSGYRSSAATSGDRSSAATSGYRSSAATSGDRSSAATSGYGSSAATSGYGSSAATSGYGSSAATSGDSSPAVCAGLHSKAKAGTWGCVVLAWWNHTEKRSEIRCREVGIGDGTDGKLKAHIWYELDDSGLFTEVSA